MINIERILFINLSHRHDRKERLLAELKGVGINEDKIIRIDAHADPLNGHKGCAISHIKALDYAIEHNLSNVLILEDDFVFTHPKEEVDAYVSRFFTHFENAWDIFLLGSNVIEYEATDHPQLKRVLCAQTTHSYVVNNHYLPILKKCFEFSLSMMKDEIYFFETTENLHAIDHVWKILQPHGRWFIGSETIGKQGESFSDIGIDQIKRFNPSFYP